MRLQLLRAGYADTSAAYAQILSHPEVWDAVKLRTEHPQSPHRETSDCWLRYNPLRNYRGSMAEFNEKHDAEWYPAGETLSECRTLAEKVVSDFGADKLGFVLMTRIPPGKQVYPHVDGGWHARYYEKFCVCIKANETQKFCFEGEELAAKSGDLFTFDNAYPHWVTNQSDEERISLIVCIHRSH